MDLWRFRHLGAMVMQSRMVQALMQRLAIGGLELAVASSWWIYGTPEPSQSCRFSGSDGSLEWRFTAQIQSSCAEPSCA